MSKILVTFASIATLLLLSGVFFIASPHIMHWRCGYFMDNGQPHYRAAHSWKWFKFITREVKDADKASFQVINKYFAKDKNRAYCESIPIYGADVSSFTPFDNHTFYSRDNHQVYYESSPISNDPLNFNIHGMGYASDTLYVYHRTRILKGFHAPTFRLIDGNPHYLADKNKVVFQGREINGADPVTFVIKEDGFAEDKNTIYRYGKVLNYVSITTGRNT